MAEKRNEHKSFVMYNDWGNSLQEFEDAELGQLLRAIYAFTTAGEEIELPDRSLRIIFNMMKECFIRDSEKWDEAKQRKREAGSKGGIAKAQNFKAKRSNAKATVANCSNAKAIVANCSNATNDVANVAVNVNVNDNVNDNVNVTVNEEVNENVNDTVTVNEDVNEEDNDKSSSMSSSLSLSSYREDFSRVIFSDEDKEELFNMSDRQQIERYIDRISAWQQENRRFMKDPCRTIKKWLREDGRKPGYYDRGYQGYSGGSYGYRNKSESERERIDREAKELARRVAEFEATLDFDTLST